MHKCILPWISIETTPHGNVRPCCLYTQELPDIDLKNHTLQDAFESKAMCDLRQSFSRGEKPAGCERCWVEENAGKKSKRQYMLEKFKHIAVDWNNTKGDKLRFLDLKLGNICNLKCRICGAWSSSKWAQEDTKHYGKDGLAYKWLKQGRWPRESEKFWKGIDNILSDIKYFEFTGGEPFLIQEHFDLLQSAVDAGYAADIDIHYNTNGTQFPKQHEIWKHFKHIQIAFSIDNTGKRFEYERFGADWQTVNDNIDKFLLLSETYPITFQLCVTWNIQNILYVQDVLDWADKKGITDVHFNLMYDPWEFSIVNMPDTTKQHVVEYLSTVKTRFVQQVQGLITTINNSESTQNTRIVERLKEIDQRRNQCFADTHPEMAALINYDK